MPSLVNLERGETIAAELRICVRMADRLRGLLGTRRLEPHQAVWITPCNAIHTFFMFMTIDVAFLDEELRVIKLIPAMTPWRMCLPVRGAVGVVEGPVGMIQAGRLRKGMRLAIVEG
jgi:hypothetical protein